MTQLLYTRRRDASPQVEALAGAALVAAAVFISVWWDLAIPAAVSGALGLVLWRRAALRERPALRLFFAWERRFL